MSRLYRFGNGHADRAPRAILGGKGHGLVEMSALGLPVPHGVILGTDVWRTWRESGVLATDLVQEAASAFAPGDMVSVRSGAPVSMPGMMDTVLNVKPTLADLAPHVLAVMVSWESDRARDYRRLFGVPDTLGTAVTIQRMVEGRGAQSGTGVAFTHDPVTGHAGLCGEYLRDAQGEDLVSGTVTPKPLADCEAHVPSAYRALAGYSRLLVSRYADAQDIEFTIEAGTLYMLQTRAAKRAPASELRIAWDLCKRGLITRSEALRRASRAFTLPASGIKPGGTVLATGTAATTRCVTGIVVKTPATALKLAASKSVILVRDETLPADLAAIHASAGVVTGAGGAMSHAAVVARALDKPCIVGVGDASALAAGATVTLDGSTGQVLAGAWLDAAPATNTDLVGPELGEMLEWRIEIARKQVAYFVRSPWKVPDAWKVRV